MPEKTPNTKTRTHSGDLGRRVAERRRELGLSREDVALRAVSWIWGFYFFADAAATSITSNTARTPR